MVRGDAERGLLQPLVVRPVGRSTLLFARFLGAAAVCVAYTFGLYFSALLITGEVGGWWPDSIAVPALELAGGVVIVVALSLLGSVFLSATANGIAIFMLFGGGIVAGLIGQIGHTINSHTLRSIGKGGSWAFPFEAGAITIVELADGQASLRAHNLTDHLAGTGARDVPAFAGPVDRGGAL